MTKTEKNEELTAEAKAVFRASMEAYAKTLPLLDDVAKASLEGPMKAVEAAGDDEPEAMRDAGCEMSGAIVGAAAALVMICTDLRLMAKRLGISDDNFDGMVKILNEETVRQRRIHETQKWLNKPEAQP